jgi:hypothetical protein
LRPAQYAAITAFYLQSNGVPLTGGAAAAGSGCSAAAARGAGPRGLTVEGAVQNFSAVTDAMLRNPPPGDWLMARRNYQAWSHQSAYRDHDGQRQELKLNGCVGDARGRLERAHAPRPQRHHLLVCQHLAKRRPGDSTGEDGDLIWRTGWP